MDAEKNPGNRRDDFVARDVDEDLIDGVHYIRMSNGDIIDPETMDAYMDALDRDDAEQAQRASRNDKLDTIVISSAAGLGVIATALAIRRLHKKKQ